MFSTAFAISYKFTNSLFNSLMYKTRNGTQNDNDYALLLLTTYSGEPDTSMLQNKKSTWC